MDKKPFNHHHITYDNYLFKGEISHGRRCDSCLYEKKNEWGIEMKRNFLTLLIIAFSIFGLFLSAEAETITKPNTFADGTPAKAS